MTGKQKVKKKLTICLPIDVVAVELNASTNGHIYPQHRKWILIIQQASR